MKTKPKQMIDPTELFNSIMNPEAVSAVDPNLFGGLNKELQEMMAKRAEEQVNNRRKTVLEALATAMESFPAHHSVSLKEMEVAKKEYHFRVHRLKTVEALQAYATKTGNIFPWLSFTKQTVAMNKLGNDLGLTSAQCRELAKVPEDLFDFLKNEEKEKAPPALTLEDVLNSTPVEEIPTEEED